MSDLTEFLHVRGVPEHTISLMEESLVSEKDGDELDEF